MLLPAGRTTIDQAGCQTPSRRPRSMSSSGLTPRRGQAAPPPGAPMAGKQLPTPKGVPVDLSWETLSPKVIALSGRPPKPPAPSRQNSGTFSVSRDSSNRSLCSGSPTAPQKSSADRQAEAGGQAMRRRVNFCPTPMNSSHAITPYGLKYGKHPSFFEFNRKGEMQLTDAGVSDEIRQAEERQAQEADTAG